MVCYKYTLLLTNYKQSILGFVARLVVLCVTWLRKIILILFLDEKRVVKPKCFCYFYTYEIQCKNNQTAVYSRPLAIIIDLI